MRKLYLLLVVALALSISSVAFAEEKGGMHEAMAELEMVDDSGYHGKAHLKDMGDGTTHVKIELEGMSGDMSMPAGIHKGTMDEYEKEAKHKLNDVEGGMSETTLDVSLEELTSMDHVIVVKKSHEDMMAVAVGEIMGMNGMPETGAGGMADPRNSAPVAGLALVGAVLAAGALLVARRRSV